MDLDKEVDGVGRYQKDRECVKRSFVEVFIKIYVCFLSLYFGCDYAV